MAPRRTPSQRSPQATAPGEPAAAVEAGSSSLATEQQPAETAPAPRKKVTRPTRSTKQSKAAAAAASAAAVAASSAATSASPPKEEAPTATSSASRSPSETPDSAYVSPALTGTSPGTSGPESSAGAPSRVASPASTPSAPAVTTVASSSTSEAPSKASKASKASKGSSRRTRVKSSEPASSVVPRPPNAWILYRSAKLRAGAPSSEHEIGVPLAPMPGPSGSTSAAEPAEPEGAATEAGQARPAAGDLSKRLSAAWKAESSDVRAHFYQLAMQRRAEHEALYPDYKFTPRITEKLARSREVRAQAAAESRRRKDEQTSMRMAAAAAAAAAAESTGQGSETRASTPPPGTTSRSPSARATSSSPKKKGKAKLATRKTSTAAAAGGSGTSPELASNARRDSYPSTPAEWAAPAPWAPEGSVTEPRGEASTSQTSPVMLNRSPSRGKRLSVDLRSSRRAGPYPPTSMRSPRSPATSQSSLETAMPSWSATARSFDVRRTVSGGAADWRLPDAQPSDVATPSQSRTADQATDARSGSPTPRRRARAATSAATSPHHRMHFDLGLGLPERQDRSAPSSLNAAAWDLEPSGLAQDPFQGWDERAEASGNTAYSADDFAFDEAHAHAHARAEELPMQIDPSLLGAEGDGMMSYGQTESASPELAEGDPLGIFGGVGAPTYETSDGTLLNFQLPDSLDRQAAMMLLMGDHGETSDGRGGGNAFLPGSSGELFALDGDHLRLAGRMQFDGVPSIHLDERQPRGHYAGPSAGVGSLNDLQAHDVRAEHAGHEQRGYAVLDDGRLSGAQKAERVSNGRYDDQWRSPAPMGASGLPRAASAVPGNMPEPPLAPGALASQFSPEAPRRPALGANARSYSYTSPAQTSPPSLATQRWPTFSGAAPERQAQHSSTATWLPSGAPTPAHHSPPPPPEPQHHFSNQQWSERDQSSSFQEHDQSSSQSRDAFNFSRPLSPQKHFGGGDERQQQLEDADMSWKRAVSAAVNDSFPVSHPLDSSTLQDALDFSSMSVSRASEHSSFAGGASSSGGMPAEVKLELNGTFSEGELLAHLEALRRRRGG